MIRAAVLICCLILLARPADADENDVGARFPGTAIAKFVTSAERDVPYDRATVIIGLRANGGSPDDVAARLAGELAPLLAALRKVVPADDALRSRGPTIRDVYETVRDGGQERLDMRKTLGSEGDYELRVELTDIGRVPEILTITKDAGATAVGVHFATSTADRVLEDLREDAVRRGVERARRLIPVAGARPGRVLEIRDYDIQGPELGMPSGPGKAYVPILPGINKLSVSVEVWVEMVSP
jgi:uncharacterized protein YggE